MDWGLFDFLDEPNIQKPIKNRCDCPYELFEIDGFMTCRNCGLVFGSIFVCDYETLKSIKMKIPYKRRTHFSLRLREIQGKLLPPDWLIKDICQTNHTNIFAIKKYLEKNKLSKYNKYVYYLFYAKTGNHLFKFNNKQICMFFYEFLKIDRIFTKYSDKNRNNMFSYYFVMKKILNKFGIKTDNKLFVCKVKSTRIRNEILWEKIFPNY